MNKLFLTRTRANDIRENLGTKDGVAPIAMILTAIAVFGAILISNIAGGKGADVVGATTLPNDKIQIIKTMDDIKLTQVRAHTNRGVYPSNIAEPFVRSFNNEPAIQEQNAFTDMTKKADGTDFDYLNLTTLGQHANAFYIENKGVKFYTQRVETVSADNFGINHTKTSVLLYVDMNGYTGTVLNKQQLEIDVCSTAKSAFGKSRVQCGGTEPVVADFMTNASTEVNLTPTQFNGTEGNSDNDGLITITIADKENLNQ